ncbi:NADH-quinone oxidoreductase subunit C [Hyphobacterium sp. CCMP332]|nr:NADH-quinone oxidoreductase subunit C [Hyphobacterium sp. CCMP332]
MTKEELYRQLEQNLEHYNVIINKVKSNRVIIDVSADDIVELSKYFLQTLKCRLVTATATQPERDFEIYYHFSHDETGLIMNLHVRVPYDQPEIKSIATLTKSANWIEREMHELFGIEFEGHPEKGPLISDGNWEPGEFPYRKKT